MITNFNIHELFPKSKTINNERRITAFHGTPTYFDNFDFKKLGLKFPDFLSYLGFHFTDQFEIAKHFTKSYKNSNQKRVISVYLNIKKTLKLTEHQLVLGIVKYILDNGYSLDGYQYDELKQYPYYDYLDEDSLYFILEDHAKRYKTLINKFKKDVLLKNGYDSIEYLNQIEDMGGKEKRYDFIALTPDIIEVIDSSNIG